MIRPPITQSLLKDAFTYNPESGDLTWKCPTGYRVKAGDVAGARINAEGYRTAGINGKSYLVHRLIWMLVYGHWPKADIDHKNGVRSDNRLCNLQDVSRSANLSLGRGRHNPIAPGVALTRHGKYVAYIHIARKRTYIGTFDTAEEAAKAYRDRHIDQFGKMSKFSV